MIKIHNFKRVNSGCKVAMFDVELTNMGFIINGMALIQSKGKSWIDYPKGCKEENGQKKWNPHCRFIDGKRNDEFLDTVNLEVAKLMTEEINSTEKALNDQLPF
jgi:hypothetical protein